MGPTATLTGFTVLCPDCNTVHHAGRVGANGFGEVVLAQMAKVTEMSPDEIQDVLRSAFREWRQRSARAWSPARSWPRSTPKRSVVVD